MALVAYASLPVGPGTGANASNFVSAGQGESVQFVATRTGTITTVAARVRSGSVLTSVHFAVYADNAGTVSGATRLGNEITVPIASLPLDTWAYVGGLAAPVVAGQTYWLQYVGIGTGPFNYTDNAATGGVTRDTAGTSETGCQNPSTTYANGPFTNITNFGVMGDDGGSPVSPLVLMLQRGGVGRAQALQILHPLRPVPVTSVANVQALTATTLHATATVVKQVGKNLSKTLTITRSLVRLVGKNVTKTVTITRTLTKRVGKNVTKALVITPTLTVSRVTLKTLTLTVHITATVVKRVSKNLSKTVTITRTLPKQVGKTLSKAVTISRSLFVSRVTLKVLTRTVTGTATMRRQTGKIVTRTVTLTATVVKRVAKTLTRAVSIARTLIAATGAMGIVSYRSASSWVSATVSKRVSAAWSAATTKKRNNGNWE